MFIPLHNHTHYSLLDGLSTIKEYVDRLQEIGASAGAITDHGTCGGLEEFQYYIQSNKIDIKPIFGIETYFVDDVNDRFSDRVVRDARGEVKKDKKTGEPLREKLRPSDFNHGCMWAQSDEGLRNLFTLSTLAYRDGMYYKPRIDMRMLKEHGDGLFVSDGCMLSAVSKAIVADDIDRAVEWEQKLIDAVGRDNVLVELHTWQFTNPDLDGIEDRYERLSSIYDQLTDLERSHPDDDSIRQRRLKVKNDLDSMSNHHREWQLNHDMRKTNRGKIEIARRLGLRMIAVNDSHYSQRSDWRWHELEWETTTKKKDLAIQDDKTEGRGETASWVMSEDECREWLIRNDVPEDVAQKAIDNTAWVADHCNASIHYGMVPPRFLDTREQDERLFRDELERGFSELVPKGEEKRYRERLEMEVELILKCDLSAYFLIVSNYANFVRDDDLDGSKYGVEGKHSSLLGPGRGCFLPGNLVSTDYPRSGNRFGFDWAGPLKKIEDVKIGEKILTHDSSFQKVLDKFEYEVLNEDCVDILLSNGMRITCTSDHCIYRENDGFVRADDLNVGDVLEGAYRPKELMEVTCSDCGNVYDIPFMKKKHNVEVDSKTRTAGEFLCHECRDRRGLAYLDEKRSINAPLGAKAAASPEARRKNSESVSRFWKEHPEIKKSMGESVRNYWANVSEEQRLQHAANTSKALSELSMDKYIRMSSFNGYKSGFFKSQKMNKDIFFASSYELKAIHIFETDSDVVSYGRCMTEDGMKPLYIQYAPTHRYNPDFDVFYSDGTHKIIEIKAAWKIGHDDVVAKADAARRYCDYHGAVYEIWTQEDLESMNDSMHRHVEVVSVRHFKYTGTVYDLHVENVHNYTVGRVTVHNSAGGSLVCYLLHITNIDPLVFNLYFERFLTAGRVISSVHVHFDDGSDESYAPDDFVTLNDGSKVGSWELLDSSRTLEDGRTVDSTSFDFRDCPDIDLDFESTIIPKFDEYIVHRYGSWNYASIGTFQMLKLSSAINDVARTTDMERDESLELVKEVRNSGWPMDDDLSSHTIEEFREKTKSIGSVQNLFRNTDFWQKVWTWGGRIRSRGIHASGYIISKESLLGMIPMRTDQKTGKLISEWDHWGVGRVGLIKFDILKLSHLNTIRQTYAAIHDGKVDIPDIYRMMRDERLLSFRSVWRPTWNGDTTAIFQMDTPLGAKTALNARIRSLRDAGLLSAVNRPGMVQSGAISHFYRVRQKREDRPEYHPMIDDILDESDGFIVYQEQIMNIFARLTKMTMGETDDVRKIIAKKKVEKMPALHDRLMRYCKADSEFVRQVPQQFRNVDECIEHMWKDIVSAGNYCFNKSHAQSYGMITSMEELLKVSAPKEFVTAALNTNPEDTALIIYAKTHNIEIMPPNVNTSVLKYELMNGRIYMPISSIKGVGGVAAEEIANAQPFRDFDDYMDRTSGRGGRKKTIVESLISLGAFDGVDPRSRFDLMCYYKNLKGDEPPQRNTYDNPRIRGSIESKLLGISLSYDPILDSKDWLESNGKTIQSDVLETPVDGWCDISGQVDSIRRLSTKKGDQMAFVNLKLYDHSLLKVTFFPKTWSSMEGLISTRDIVSVRCRRNEDFNGSPSFVAFKLKNGSVQGEV